MTFITRVTLVTGTTASAREAVIAAALDPDVPTGLILEGLPDGKSTLDTGAFRIDMARIAPGCICCTGNITMRVTLNRMLRRHPARLYIGLATADHLERIRDFLESAPYDALLSLTQDLHA